MQALYELKDILMSELEEYGKKGELSAGTLEIVDKLCHAIKNLDKIIWCCEEGGYSENDGYSNNSYGSYGNGNRSMSMGGGSYRNSYYSGESNRSYARNRDSRGRYSRGSYSRHGNLAERVRGMMAEAPDDRTRQEMENLAYRLEEM